MADRVDVKITAITPDGTKNNTNINYANPNASNSTLKTLAQKLNQLTRNSYDKSSKVETTQLDTAPDSSRQVPTFTFEKTAYTQQEASSSAPFSIPFTYNGDGEIYCTGSGTNPAIGLHVINNTLKIVYAGSASSEAYTISPIKIFATATSNYEATDVVTITITQ